MRYIFWIKEASEYLIEFSITADISIKIFASLFYALYYEDNCIIIITYTNYCFSAMIHKETYILKRMNKFFKRIIEGK